MTYDSVIEVDESFGKTDSVAPVLVPSKGTSRVGAMRADVIGAEFPPPRIVRKMVKKEKHGIAIRELMFVAYNPGGPFVGSTIWGSGGFVVKLEMRGWVAVTSGGFRSRHCLG